MNRLPSLCRFALLVAALACGLARLCEAGMPALLPTNWTADNPNAPSTPGIDRSAADARWQALSFFAVCVLLSGWALKALWNYVRRDFSWMPELSYGRSLGIVVLWGLLFVVVLTMISGARELMTPGAWKKQGWTYTLAEAKRPDDSAARDQALERLRFALWDYAARHEGRFPDEDDSVLDRALWVAPGPAQLRYVYRPGQSVDQTGSLLAFEPAMDAGNRRVLLTNGFIGAMSTRDIEAQLGAASAP